VYSVWDGTTKTAIAPLGDVYAVSSAAQLAWLADQDNDFAGKTIFMAANIDLNRQDWKPIGTAAKPFKGTFKGKGHLIKGFLEIKGQDGIGLFGHVAKEAVIDSLGISGGTIVAASVRRAGAIAGVCAGQINQCWSMAEIALDGTMVGGLVGEMTATGTMTDCYHTGLIIGARDTIGCLIGKNAGKVIRSYNAGYAKNGFAIVGFNAGGTYTNCYYDRKVYYMQPGAEGTGIIPLDETEKMYKIFDDQPTIWSLGTTKRYPVLKAFAATDAALLSAAPMYINTTEDDPVNHATDLTEDFTVCTDGGITWNCQDETNKQWIKIVGANVQVTRPCSGVEVFVDVKLNKETRVAYMRPIRWNDFKPGTAAGNFKSFCFKEEALITTNMAMKPAEYGWEDGRYYYMLQRSIIKAPGDTVALDTLFNGDATPALRFEAWLSLTKLPTDKAGLFVLRRFAHDSVCVLDWVRSEGEFVYRVFEEFDPGEIKDNTTKVDSVFMPVNITVPSVKPATGGGGPITYTWLQNGNAIPSSNNATLSGYTNITKSGTYTFTRQALDSAECGANNKTSKGKYIVVVLDPFKPGKIDDVASKTFCTVEEAKAYTIKGTAASGGVKPYRYEWYLASPTDTIAIKNSNTQDLSLNLDTIKAGNTYTFVRKAEDASSLTKLTLCDNKTIIKVMTEIVPGAIENITLDDYCAPYNATGETTYTISVKEKTPAQGDPNMEYMWKRLENGKDHEIVAYTRELNYTHKLKDITFGHTYSYVRYVRNPGCDWYRSAGEAIIYYGQNTREDKVITICSDAFPYTLEWTDGKTYTFADEKSTLTIEEKKADGRCIKQTHFTVETVSTPVFSVEEEAFFCQNTESMTLHITQESGKSNNFYITYLGELEKLMGKKDTTGLIPEDGVIVFNNMPNLGDKTYTMTVRVGYASASTEGVCYSKEPMFVYIHTSLGGYVYSKYDRVIFVDNNPENGAISGEKLEFVSYQWYKDGNEQAGKTGQYYHEDGRLLNGEYYVKMVDSKGISHRSCSVFLPKETASGVAPQVNVVYPVPVGAGQPLTLECIGDARIVSFAGECVTVVGQVDGQATVSAPRVPGMYYVQITTPEGTMEMHKLIVK
jgi:hypothetical protein